MMTDSQVLYQRVSIDGEVGTVRWRGLINNKEWLGIEWDSPLRGKHNGFLNGVQYFTTTHPTSGSFVNPKTKVIDYSRDFISALLEKYTTSEKTEILKVDGINKDVETVGWDKINTKQGDLKNLKEVGLSNCCIGFTDGDGSILKSCPNITDIDLSKNLFSQWSDITPILLQLNHLHSLRLNYNRFIISSVQYQFMPITTLALNHTLLSWNDLHVLATCFPNLEELHFGFNQLVDLNTQYEDKNSLQKLKILNLESNKLSNWKIIHASISKLPSLTHLYINGNELTGIDVCDSESFKTLKFMNLNSNCINLTSINNLNTYPSLVELRFKPTPGLFTTPVNLRDSDMHLLLIARLSKITLLNGSTVTDRIRIDAEVYYLNQCGQNISTPDFHQLHPRYNELVEKYGEPSIVPVSLTSNSLKDRLLNLTILYGEKTIEKRIPGTFGIRNLKGLVARGFGLRNVGLVKIVVFGNEHGEGREVDDDLVKK